MHAHFLSQSNSIVFGLVGTLLVGLALPLIAKIVAPNPWYGFRVEKTLSNAHIWYEANRIAGVDLLIAGVAILLTALITYAVQQRSNSCPVTVINVTVTAVAVVASNAHAWWALQNIK